MKMKWVVFLIACVAVTSICLDMTTVSRAQDNDDYITISQMTTMKERREFFLTLTPERKSALWRKHYMTELSKHPDLTPAQKEVVNLAIVIARPDIFTGKLPNVSGPGSVFETALKNAFQEAPKLRDEIFGQPATPLSKPAQQENSRRQ